MKTLNPRVFLREGELYAFVEEVPEKPEFKGDYFLHYGPHRQYEEAIERAKASAIKVKNHDEVIRSLIDKGVLCLPTHTDSEPPYTLEGYQMEVVDGMSEGWQPTYNNPDNSGCEQPAEPIKLAIISPVVEQKQEPQDDWMLSRVKMPDFDGFYYVYGFMHHSCGNVTPFHKIVECRMNQWVKIDLGEQMTYWRQLLQPPIIESHEQ